MKTFTLAGTEFEMEDRGGPHLEWARWLTSCAEVADSLKAERAWFHHPSARTRNPCGCRAESVAFDDGHFRCCECGAEWNEAWNEDL